MPKILYTCLLIKFKVVLVNIFYFNYLIIIPDQDLFRVKKINLG